MTTKSTLRFSIGIAILSFSFSVILSGCGGGGGSELAKETSSPDVSAADITTAPPPPPLPAFASAASTDTLMTDVPLTDHRSVYRSAVRQIENLHPCHMFISGDPVLNGFGVPWNVTSPKRELLVRTTCTDSSVNIEVGNDNPLQYIYHQGYYWENGEWNIYNLQCNGELIADAWCIESARSTLSGLDMDKNNWIVAYVCEWIQQERRWKCGCADADCRSRYWQLQAFPGFFQYPVDYRRDAPNGWTTLKHGHGSLNRYSDANTEDPFRPHRGADYNKGGGCGDRGEQVYAVADGTIVKDEASAGAGWGRVILIEHDAPAGTYFRTGDGSQESTVYSLYGHLLNPNDEGYLADRKMTQKEGEAIKMGDRVGQVGDGSGYYPNACHLHFEIQIDSSVQPGDPNYYARNPYTWDMVGTVDPLEFIRNNQLRRYTDARTFIESAEIVVHAYGDGRAVSPLSPFLLDYQNPSRGVDPADHNGSVDPCDANYTYGIFASWRRGGCNYGDWDLGYNGEIFWKSADQDGTARWQPFLPRDGQYRVSVFVTVDTKYGKGLAHYRLVDAGERLLDEFTIDQSSYALSFPFRSAVVPAPELVLRPPDGKQHGAWVNVGVYQFTAGNDAYLGLTSSTSHQGVTGEPVAVDAVKFTYVGP